ncbi:sigma-70 family RNA polymerase sigma factor [Thalassoroseus pseudoceratinae]|uniref:sigma-70 family RNA polymerase sigma factor n=1 Tax=Thalassoroseus pseudoceratinae TaxID=2713176 RepID=UPI001421F4A6|nr:sigma-70 family RNA polymerase sigma factor [Thalassoroseus pseudoceratinae]
MHQANQSEEFVQQLTEHQTRLYGYVYSLLGDHSRTADVVQETNLVLWRKIDEFDPTKPFLPWAFAIARFQVLAHLRDQKRDRMLLDAELAETISSEAERQAETIDLVRLALRQCLQRLTDKNRELIEHRYIRSMSVADVASAAEKTVGAIKVAILRIRRQLAECVQQRTSTGGLQ